MSHNLFNERFYSLRRPAWHGLGKVSEVEMGAVEAYGGMVPITVTLEPSYSRISGDYTEVEGRRDIWRHPVPDDPQFRLLGTVGTDYRLIDPLRVCELYDENVQRPIETMGILGKGETLFLSTQLSSYAVKTDEIESYLLVESPYSGNAAIRIRVTPVRVVCQNTLIAARGQASETYAIRHDQEAERDLGLWMGGIVDRAEGKIATLREAFEQMAAKRVTPVDLESLLIATFPNPKEPNRSHPSPDFVVRAEARYEEATKYAKTAREVVRELFEGRGVGQDTEAAAGTAFGLFNAVAERAQYASGIRGSSGLWDAVNGFRAQESERAFQAIWDFSRMPDLVDVVPAATARKTAPKRKR